MCIQWLAFFRIQFSKPHLLWCFSEISSLLFFLKSTTIIGVSGLIKLNELFQRFTEMEITAYWRLREDIFVIACITQSIVFFKFCLWKSPHKEYTGRYTFTIMCPKNLVNITFYIKNLTIVSLILSHFVSEI